MELLISYILIYVLMRIGINMLVAIKRLTKITIMLCFTTGLNLIVSIVLVQSLGVRGVIWGTVIGNSVAVIPTLIIFQQEFRVGWFDIWRKILLPVYPAAFIGMSATILVMTLRSPHNIIDLGIYGAIGMAAFVGVFFLFGIPSHEKKALLGYVRKLKDQQ